MYHSFGFASLNGTFHLLPHENICTIAVINIHYLYIINPIDRSFDCLKDGHMALIISDNVHVWKLVHVCIFYYFPWLSKNVVTAIEFGTRYPNFQILHIYICNLQDINDEHDEVITLGINHKKQIISTVVWVVKQLCLPGSEVKLHYAMNQFMTLVIPDYNDVHKWHTIKSPAPLNFHEDMIFHVLLILFKGDFLYTYLYFLQKCYLRSFRTFSRKWLHFICKKLKNKVA